MAWLLTIALVLSLSASLLMVPLVRWFAHRVGMEDCPDSERKLHRKPIALGGGIAVLFSLVFAFVVTVIFDRKDGEMTLDFISMRWYVLFWSAAAMLLVGLVDDIWALRGRQKLLLQCLIISAVVGSGTIINQVSVLGFDVQLGLFSYPITVLWLLMAVNALNLIDGADGMATTAGCIISAGLAILSWQTGSWHSAVVGAAMTGALLGFLVFNRPPASIFLGDAGSMMIGLFVGVLAVWSNVKESTVLASAPVAVLALPLFDSTAAIVRRWLTGRSIYATDRGHLHHLLQEKFGSAKMLIVVASLSVVTTLLSVLSVSLAMPWLAGVGVLVVFGFLVFTRSFGHAECQLVVGRGKNFAKSFLTRLENTEQHKLQTRVPLQGSGDWDTVWEPLVEFAKSRGLAKVRIDLNLSWLHEGYHATWNSIRLPEKACQLVIRLPLFTKRKSDSEQVSIGILEIVAPANDPTIYHRIADLSERLVALGPEIDAVIDDLESSHQNKGRKDEGMPDPPRALKPRAETVSSSS